LRPPRQVCRRGVGGRDARLSGAPEGQTVRGRPSTREQRGWSQCSGKGTGKNLSPASLSAPAPNKGVELTAYSVRSCLASAFSRRSRLALGASGTKERTPKTISSCRRRCPHDDTCWLCGSGEYGPTHGTEFAQGRLRAPCL